MVWGGGGGDEEREPEGARQNCALRGEAIVPDHNREVGELE